MAEIVREAVLAYVTREPRKAPPGAGAFESGQSDTAQRVNEVLAETGFGVTGVPTRPASRAVRAGRNRAR